jgi:hypothetical protein
MRVLRMRSAAFLSAWSMKCRVVSGGVVKGGVGEDCEGGEGVGAEPKVSGAALDWAGDGDFVIE